MATCGLCSWKSVPGARHNAGTCELFFITCATQVPEASPLYLRPAACDCKEKVCKAECALCLEKGHTTMTLKYEAAFRLVRYYLVHRYVRSFYAWVVCLFARIVRLTSACFS